MDEYTIYKYIEFVFFSLYLFMVFLSTQMWFIWIDVDKNKLRSKILDNELFFKKNIIIVFFIGVFFMAHEIVEGINFFNSYLYFEFFELLGIICVVLFIYRWYSTLKSCAIKKPAYERFPEVFTIGKVKIDGERPLFELNKINKFILLSIFCFTGIVIGIFVPVSTIFFTLIIGLLFVPPFLALISIFFGVSKMSKKPGIQSN